MKGRVQITAYAVSALYSLALALSGLHLSSTTSKLLSFVPTAIVLLFAIWDFWAWHLPVLIRIARRPYLSGTWKGTLSSLREAEDGVEREHEPVDIVLAVKQSYLGISVTLMTKESKSRSIAEQLIRNDNGDYTLYYQYRNLPKLAIRDRSPEHSGSSCLETSGRTPKTLEGEYWTNRRTRGSLQLTFVSRKIVGSFSEPIKARTA